MLKPNSPTSSSRSQQISSASTSEGLNNNLNIPPTTTRSTSNPILQSLLPDNQSDSKIKNETKNQTKSASQLNKLENTNISIDESTTYSPSSVNLEHSSFFSRNYNESLIRLLSSSNSTNSNEPQQQKQQSETNRINAHSVLNNLKLLSGSILNTVQNTIQKPFQNSNQNVNNHQYESHTCNLGYRMNNNLNYLNRTSIEPLIDSQTMNQDNQFYYPSARYQQYANDSPSFSASSSNNFSFNTISTNLTSVNSKTNQQINDFTNKSTDDKSFHQLNDDLHSTIKSTNTSSANLLNNNIFKLNLDNLQNGDEQNAFNMCGTASLSNKQLTIYEKRYLLAVERGDLAGVRRMMIEMAPQIEQEKDKNDNNGPVFNINCCDPIGRSALLMAIDNENLDMIELLVECGVEMRDSLLHAINEEFVEAVELLLDYEEALQRNKRAAFEASLEKQNDDDIKTIEMDKPINFSYDFRPTLLQINKDSDDKNNCTTNTSSTTATINCNQTNVNQTKNINQKTNKSINQQTQNNICNKLNVNKQQTPIQIPIQPIVYSWEGFERETFTSDVTPLILAAHKNNYEIIKLLLDRGISKCLVNNSQIIKLIINYFFKLGPIPCPHDARCGCRECAAALQSDCLRYSRSRINAYRALASPSLIGK